MHRRWITVGIAAGVLASLWVAPGVRADTCCANSAVTFAPRTAEPGDVVGVGDIVCLAPDNGGPLELNLAGFWLSRDDVPADERLQGVVDLGDHRSPPIR